MFGVSISDRIVFPPFQLDLAAGRLSQGSKSLGLRPKAFSVLQYLVERPGKLVSKEELIQENWRDVHVGDDVLKVAIAEIRKVLEDPPKAPKFIETAHRRGYRFIAKTEATLDRANGPLAPSSGRHFMMQEARKTQYAKSDDTNIAYQVIGDGPIDLVFVMGWVSHLDYFWTEPSFARFLRRLASFSRLILFDKRGSGLSDRVPVNALPTLEQRMDDVRAVMDAVGSKRAALCGVSEGGVMSALFSATYPERTSALVMIGSYARRLRAAGYPWGPTEAQREVFLDEIREQWGGPVGLEERAPSMANDPVFREWWSAYLRTSASPAAAVALTKMNSEADIRDVLPAIRVPSLVLHRAGDQCLCVEEGRYTANRIPECKFVELPGEDHLPFVGDQDSLLDEIEHFLTGKANPSAPETFLATVLSASFQRPSGDKSATNQYAWNRLEQHVSRALQFHRGRRYLQSGRSLQASFDGPARAIRCIASIAQRAASLGLGMAAGLHAGECTISEECIRGAAVNIAGKIHAEARMGEILVSATVRDLVAGSGLIFQPKQFLSGPGPLKLPLLIFDREKNQTIP
jgi:pimeloyl-ACP methyl ester carboxylesterase